ncbi:MAG: hypothetical protein NUW01_15165 [Gemmatimonadaceae bacterium]|nr:hypothetical protein [Gemmatimonadaceae bacterium]
MKRVLAVAAIVAAGVFLPDVAQAQAQKSSAPVGRQASITGTVVDVSCKFGQGLSGADHRMCAEVCSDRGIPLAILGDDGKLYVPTSAAMPGDAQNSRLRPFAEQQVRVSGRVFAAGGANAIQIASIERGR